MRQLILLLTIASLFFACGNSGKKEKEPATIDTTPPIHGDTDSQKPIMETPAVIPDSTKTINLTFSGYEEGDYAHLMFTITGLDTVAVYDFGHPDDNALNDIPVVVKDSKTAFGYKENKKMVGTKYVAQLVYKMTDTYDDNGQPKKGKEWRIASLKKAE